MAVIRFQLCSQASTHYFRRGNYILIYLQSLHAVIYTKDSERNSSLPCTINLRRIRFPLCWGESSLLFSPKAGALEKKAAEFYYRLLKNHALFRSTMSAGRIFVFILRVMRRTKQQWRMILHFFSKPVCNAPAGPDRTRSDLGWPKTIHWCAGRLNFLRLLRY